MEEPDIDSVLVLEVTFLDERMEDAFDLVADRQRRTKHSQLLLTEGEAGHSGRVPRREICQ